MRSKPVRGTTRRLFYGLLFPEGVKERIEEVIDRLGRLDIDHSVRWTPARNLHLTLRFLGDLDPKVGLDAEWLPDEAGLPGEMRLKVGRPQAFPSLQRPRVLVVAVDGLDKGSSGRLLRLQRKLEERAEEIGIEPERREFRPHITLGRVRRGARPSARLMDEFTDQSLETGPILVQRLSLIESHLGPKGADYHEVKSWQLPSGE